jgi:hypothetical protein
MATLPRLAILLSTYNGENFLVSNWIPSLIKA